MRVALFKYGIPKKDSHQQAFLRDILFNIGGNFYSFCEWLCKISGSKVTTTSLRSSVTGRGSIQRALRSSTNSSAPAATKQQSSKIAEAEFESPADHRVIFATNFFRSRGTAVTHFTAESIEKELNIMALAFVADDANVLVDTKRGELKLSNVFAWFRHDFASGPSNDESDKGLIQLVSQYVESPKKLNLQQLLYSGNSKKVKVSFHSDDWSANASKKDTHTFSSSVLEANSTRF